MAHGGIQSAQGHGRAASGGGSLGRSTPWPEKCEGEAHGLTSLICQGGGRSAGQCGGGGST